MLFWFLTSRFPIHHIQSRIWKELTATAFHSTCLKFRDLAQHTIDQDFEKGCPKWSKIPNSTKLGCPLSIYYIIKIWILRCPNEIGCPKWHLDSGHHHLANALWSRGAGAEPGIRLGEIGKAKEPKGGLWTYACSNWSFTGTRSVCKSQSSFQQTWLVSWLHQTPYWP